MDGSSVDPSTGIFRILLPVNLTDLDRTGENVHGFLVGKDPVNAPIWVPLPTPVRVKEPLGPGKFIISY